MSKQYYKGLDNDFKCQGFQFEVGKTYKHDGEIKLCSSGFHVCKEPLDVLTYYPVACSNRYAVVEIKDVSEEKGDDSKVVAGEISIIQEITIDDLISAHVKLHKDKKDSSQSASSGDYSQSVSSGYSSQSASSGDCSQSVSSGYYSQSVSSGHYSKSASSGHYSQSASSGYASQSVSSGHASQSASSGHYSQSVSSGDCSQSASSGYASQSVSSGHASQSASSGDYSKSASSGHYSQSASSGDSCETQCDTNGFACIAGTHGKVKGNSGSALSLGYIDKNKRNRIAVAYVGEDGIKAGVWYRVNRSGKFIEVKA